ncbi:LysM peptidoglycan-binding and 3D domain-containing protein [uncultured Metabacillus sp.]|uniref:3D domain-containing protein n=1 Tax=uncultured Metabacillus sp. TaxID=2860135 RepID=UPI002637EB80|nr:LysM peptidoglycan-binding and 3D domain-containing protein [uncultured Metabacillus sp.]
MKKGIVSLITTALFSAGFAVNASAEEIKVKEGDTLSEIAKQKEVSVDDLKEWNDLTGDIIHPNDTLELPEYYEIVKGDSLWEIAQENNLTVDKLKDLNDIDSHIIHPGDELILDGVDAANVKAATTNAKPTEKKVASKLEKAPVKQAKPSVEKELTVTATAYTANCEGCSGITSTGIDLNANPDQKVIAVDPDVIPLGTKVHVEGYGTAIAGDIGGAIKGNRIDVFIPSKAEAKEWGRKQVEVKILN